MHLPAPVFFQDPPSEAAATTQETLTAPVEANPLGPPTTADSGLNPMVLLIMMYDLEKASKSAYGISLYVSDNPEGSDEVLGPAGAGFPDQEARPVI